MEILVKKNYGNRYTIPKMTKREEETLNRAWMRIIKVNNAMKKRGVFAQDTTLITNGLFDIAKAIEHQRK